MWSILTDRASVDLTKHTGGNLVDGADYSKAWSAIVLVSMIFYVASYATGLGNVPWQQGELFSLEGKSFHHPPLLFAFRLPTNVCYYSQCAVSEPPSRRSAIGQATYSSGRHTSHLWTASRPPAHSGSTRDYVCSGGYSACSVSQRRRG